MSLVAAIALGVGVAYLALLALLLLARPRDVSWRDALRLLPDLARLVARLARDRTIDRRVRAGLWLLLGYLALPVDLVPDFVPVLGYADDAIVVVLTLRWVLERAGQDALQRHWPGTPDGLHAVQGLLRLGP